MAGPSAEPRLVHRLIVTDTGGREIPAGRTESGESLGQAAVRETDEETGWPPGPPRTLGANRQATAAQNDGPMSPRTS